jgi:16S rRNA (cytosine1402-N4)-methyltransferase
MIKTLHFPVMLAECVSALAIRPEGIYVDGTFGRGGHSQAILSQLNEHGRLIALDQDQVAIDYGQQLFAEDSRVRLVHTNFAQLSSVIDQAVDGILLDLGVSSPQIDTAERGFSFMQAGPLDMRMNGHAGLSLLERLEKVSVVELVGVIRSLGEEKFAQRIAVAILEALAAGRLTDTLALANVITDAQPVKDKHKHPATRTFQALRMWVNEELSVLSQVLMQAIACLKPGGRLAVISFHSLEDRLVKQFFREQSRGKYNDQLRMVEGKISVHSLGKYFPSREETEYNPRSRSAVLRVVERLVE